MRIESNHSCPSTTNNRSRVASSQTDNGFADQLASAVDASDSDTDTATDTRPPELSAATYRLFAAIDLERGDTLHAALHLSQVPDAREAGLPLHPAGLLSGIGRWDYTEEAAALPETGRFDTASGQGEATFIPYNARPAQPAAASECDPAETAGADATTETAIDRLRAAASTASTRNIAAPDIALRAGIEELLES
jgi:hypothetical protein